MSTIKSSAEDLTFNADGANDIKNKRRVTV